VNAKMKMNEMTTLQCYSNLHVFLATWTKRNKSEKAHFNQLMADNSDATQHAPVAGVISQQAGLQLCMVQHGSQCQTTT